MSNQKQKVMVVSNRTDRALEARIAHDLSAKVHWVVNKKRQLQAAARALESGRFDILILVTGFLSHSTVDILAKSAEAAKVRIVYADRGRPAAIARAMQK